MIERAFIATRAAGRLAHEEQLVATELEARGVPFDFYTLKKIHRRQLPLSPRTLVVGDMDCVYGALKQLQVPIPEADSYPKALCHHWHRDIWESNLGREKARFLREDGHLAPPVFIKPRGRQKRFTGFVYDSPYDSQRIHGVSRREPIHCSEVVEWKSEYRVYVLRGEILSIDHYDGDPQIPIDRAVVEDAILSLMRAGPVLAGFGIDFGVLSTGETALVEMNDGFALGAYSIDAKSYTDLLIARWLELTGVKVYREQLMKSLFGEGA